MDGSLMLRNWVVVCIIVGSSGQRVVIQIALSGRSFICRSVICIWMVILSAYFGSSWMHQYIHTLLLNLHSRLIRYFDSLFWMLRWLFVKMWGFSLNEKLRNRPTSSLGNHMHLYWAGWKHIEAVNIICNIVVHHGVIAYFLIVRTLNYHEFELIALLRCKKLLLVVVFVIKWLCLGAHRGSVPLSLRFDIDGYVVLAIFTAQNDDISLPHLADLQLPGQCICHHWLLPAPESPLEF